MAEEPDPRSRRTSRPPLWLVEGADLVDRRRGTLLLTVGIVAVVGALAAWLVPAVVPPTPLVGAAIGLAGVLLGLAAVVATDATEAIVRGPRHVRAAGGELVAVLPGEASLAAARPLAGAVVEARQPSQTLLLGLSSAGRDAAGTLRWVEELARALAEDGTSVLAVDLVSAPDGRPGLLEFARGEHTLPEVVRFEPALRLAHLGAGRDRSAGIEALPTLRGRMPRDLDVLVVALPPAANRQVVRAARALDHLLLTVQRDVTAKVDLIASLDAMDTVGTHAQVVLHDDRTASALSAGAPRVGAVGPVATPEASASEVPVSEASDGATGQELPEDAAEEPRAEGAADDDAPVEGHEDPPSEPDAEVHERPGARADADGEADPAPGGTGPDPGEGASEPDAGGGAASDPRDVEVLLGAAAAVGTASLLAEHAEETPAGPDREPDPEPDPEPVPEPVLDPEPLLESALEPQPDADATSDLGGAGAPSVDDDAPLERRPDLAVTTHLDAVAEREPTGTVPSPVVPEVDPSPEVPPIVDPEPERPIDPGPDPGPETVPPPVVPVEPEPEPEVTPEPEPEVTPEPETEREREPEPEPEPEAEPDAAEHGDGSALLDLAGEPGSAVAEGPPVVVDDGPTPDDTDRLPRVARPEPVLGDGGDDLLRTTAQLAVLLDDLQERTVDEDR